MKNNVVIKELYGEGDWLYCPLCNGEYGHIQEVENIQCEYGIGLRVIIKGECGHFWRFRIIPFKGNLKIFSERNDDGTKCGLKESDSYEWRFRRDLEFRHRKCLTNLISIMLKKIKIWKKRLCGIVMWGVK